MCLLALMLMLMHFSFLYRSSAVKNTRKSAVLIYLLACTSSVHIQKFVMTCSALHCSSISHNMTAQVQIPGFFFFHYFGYALPTGQALPADPA